MPNQILFSHASAPPPAFKWFDKTNTSGEFPYAFKILFTLSVGVKVSSIVLISVDGMPNSLKRLFKYSAIFNAYSFSIIPLPLAPGSDPPCRRYL